MKILHPDFQKNQDLLNLVKAIENKLGDYQKIDKKSLSIIYDQSTSNFILNYFDSYYELYQPPKRTPLFK